MNEYMNKLSCFIIAQDEVDRIGATLESLKGLCDEIVVIDSGSSDGTQALCETLGARVIFNAWQGYGAQKRFGETQCAHDWVLNLDADEVLTPLLSPQKDAYEILFQDAFPQETKIAPFTYHRKFIRLYNQTKTRFSESPVHDSVLASPAQTGRLKHICLHYSFRSLTHAIAKANGYTTMQAQDLVARGKRPPFLRLFFEFPLAFIKIYFLRRFFLRGREGFTYAMLYAFGRFSRLAKWHEQMKEQG
jgi:glycosyltransferase involved in cell wall biosynthesis